MVFVGMVPFDEVDMEAKTVMKNVVSSDRIWILSKDFQQFYQ
jgi:hypothetical protein